MAAEADLPIPRRGWTRPHQTGVAQERLFKAAIVACLATTLLVMLPGVHGHAVVPTIDLVLDTMALFVTGMLTALAWARFRERRQIVAAFHAAAFLALAVGFGIAVIISLEHSGSLVGLAEPENVQVLVFATARMAAAILLVVAGTSLGRRFDADHAVVIVVGPTVVVLGAAIVGWWLNPPPDALQIIRFTDASGLPHITPFGAAVNVVTASLFFTGAYVSRSLWRSSHEVIDGWIAVGLVFAGFAELQWALYPSAHPGQVSSADLLWLGFSVLLLIGLGDEVRVGLRELRATNAELVRLRDADLERAALEERARLARELHDGLAQDLWLAKLRTGELASIAGLPVEARRAIDDAVAAIDSGLSDAREAVAALRGTAHAETGFCSLVRRTAEDFGDRFGLRVEFVFEGEHMTSVAHRTQAEILRILHEALTNVARHAAATIVGVRLTIKGERITLRVVDNGRGFDPKEVRPDTFGQASMRERAALIEGRIRVASRAGSGTLVVLTAPLARTVPLARPAALNEAARP